MKQGHLPKEIQSKTLKYYWAFGPNDFYEDDLEKLNAWATSIQILNFKLRHNKQFQEDFVVLAEPNLDRDPDDMDADRDYYRDLSKNEEIERNQQMFDEFVKITGKVKDYFQPMGRPSRPPKLFTNL